MSAKKNSKRDYEKAVRCNITLPPKLHQDSAIVVKKFGYSSLSDYFQGRLRKDLGLDLAA